MAGSDPSPPVMVAPVPRQTASERTGGDDGTTGGGADGAGEATESPGAFGRGRHL